MSPWHLALGKGNGDLARKFVLIIRLGGPLKKDTPYSHRLVSPFPIGGGGCGEPLGYFALREKTGQARASRRRGSSMPAPRDIELTP